MLEALVCFVCTLRSRHNLNVELQYAREFNDGQALSDVYTFLSKLEKYERAVMNCFCTRQAIAEEDRFMNLTRTTCLFKQVRTVRGAFAFTSAATSRPFVPKGFAAATLFSIDLEHRSRFSHFL